MSCNVIKTFSRVLHLHLFHPQAANYLNIKSLLDLTCMTVANMIKGAPQPCTSSGLLSPRARTRSPFFSPE